MHNISHSREIPFTIFCYWIPFKWSPNPDLIYVCRTFSKFTYLFAYTARIYHGYRILFVAGDVLLCPTFDAKAAGVQ